MSKLLIEEILLTAMSISCRDRKGEIEYSEKGDTMEMRDTEKKK